MGAFPSHKVDPSTGAVAREVVLFKADDCSLVNAKHPLNCSSKQDCQVSLRTESPVGDPHVTRLHFGMHPFDLRHVMSTQGRGTDH
jgi:hypothetical protein